jgi:hypothetical protein
MSYTYQAYGLTIRVPFACPALTLADSGCVAPRVGATGVDLTAVDVVVREGLVPRRLRAPRDSEASWDAAPGLFLLRGGRRAGRFLVEADAVTFERNSGCEDAILARHFTDQVLAALLRHRGLLVLHANAVEVSGGVIVICGESGTGKSTTLAALRDRGGLMLSDDVTALLPGGAPKSVKVLPGVAQTHLAEDAAQGLGYTVDPAQLQPWRRMKAAIPTHDGMAWRAGRLRALYILRVSGGDDVVVTQVTGGDKFHALQECMYGPMFTEDHPTLFPLMSTIVNTVPFFWLERPAGRWSIGEVGDAILGSVPELVP